MKKKPDPTPTEKLIYRLRLMAEVGGMLTKDRVKTVAESAERLEEFFKRIESGEGK